MIRGGKRAAVVSAAVAAALAVAVGSVLLVRGHRTRTATETSATSYPAALIAAYKSTPGLDKSCPLLQGTDAGRATYDTSNHDFAVRYPDGTLLIFTPSDDPTRPTPADLPSPLPSPVAAGRLYPMAVFGGFLVIDGNCQTYVTTVHSTGPNTLQQDPEAALRFARSLVPVPQTTVDVA